MEKITNCVELNGINYCQVKKKHITKDDCKSCPNKTEPSLNENLQVLCD